MGLTFLPKKVAPPLVPMVWKGCYEQRWHTHIVPAAFAHPAKTSRALLIRIYNYLLDREVLHPGDTVLDPFAGVGTTAIEGAVRQMLVIGVELEPKFVAMAHANIEKHRRYWEGMGYPIPMIVQGDSRQLRQLVGGVMDTVVSSPPYAGSLTQGNAPEGYDYTRYGGGGQLASSQTYGKTEGQLERMVSGDVDAVVSSPPYWKDRTHSENQTDIAPEVREKLSKADLADRRYGFSNGQLGEMRSGQIDVVIGGPPSENSDQNWHDGLKRVDLERGVRAGMKNDGIGIGRQWGLSAGNICHEQGETFWVAACQVIHETYALLKPGGVAVWIVKAFVRDRQYVDFPAQWRRLCERVGFQTREEIHAVFTREFSVKGHVVRRVERKSFFRRLAEKKGSPRVDWETIWVMQKPQ